MTTNADSGAGSLRQAIRDSNADTGQTNTISINPGIGTISLSSNLPIILHSVQIQAPSSQVINGNNSWRPFFVMDGLEVEIENIKVQNGCAKGGSGGRGAGGGLGAGGGVFIHGPGSTVTLTNVEFEATTAQGGHGGAGHTVVAPSAFSGGGGGGGLGGNGGEITGAATQNSGGGGGGGVYGNGGNSTSNGGGGGGGGGGQETSAGSSGKGGAGLGGGGGGGGFDGNGGDGSIGGGGGGGGGKSYTSLLDPNGGNGLESGGGGGGKQGPGVNGNDHTVGTGGNGSGIGSGGGAGGLTNNPGSDAVPGSGQGGGGGGYGSVNSTIDIHGGMGGSDPSALSGGGGGGGGSIGPPPAPSATSNCSGGAGSDGGGGGGGGRSLHNVNTSGGHGGNFGGGGGAARTDLGNGSGGNGGTIGGGGGGAGGIGDTLGTCNGGHGGVFAGGGGGIGSAGSSAGTGGWGGAPGGHGVSTTSSAKNGLTGGFGAGGSGGSAPSSLGGHGGTFGGNGAPGSTKTIGPGGGGGALGGAIFIGDGSTLIMNNCSFSANDTIAGAAGGTGATAGTTSGKNIFGGDNVSMTFAVPQNTVTVIGSLEISGVGSEMIKSGQGTLELADTPNSIGNVIVTEGTLTVNSPLTGAVTVSAPATLQGVGPITGEVNVSGTTAPGNSIGTMTVVGNYTQQSGSTLEIELDATLNSDLLDVSGTVQILSPSTLDLQFAAGSYPTTATYTIITSSGGISGKFSTVIGTSSPSIFASSTVNYLPNQIDVVIQQLSSSVVFPSGNAQAIAAALLAANVPASSPLGMAQTLLLASTSVDQATSFLNQLSPTSLKGASVAQEETSFLIQSWLRNYCTHFYNACDCTEANDWHLWLDGGYERGDQKNKSEFVGYRSNTGLAAIGLDYLSTSGLFAGASFFYTTTKIDLRLASGHCHTNGYLGNLYGGWSNHFYFMTLSLLGGYINYVTHRNIVVTPNTYQAYSNHGGFEGDASLSFGLFGYLNYLRFSPYVAIDYLYLHENSFTEKRASNLGTHVKSSNYQAIRPLLGVDFSYALNPSHETLRNLDLNLAVAYEDRFQGKNYTANFITQDSTFTVLGLNPNRFLFVPTLSFKQCFANNPSSLSLTYQGAFASHFNDQSISFQISW